MSPHQSPSDPHWTPLQISQVLDPSKEHRFSDSCETNLLNRNQASISDRHEGVESSCGPFQGSLSHWTLWCQYLTDKSDHLCLLPIRQETLHHRPERFNLCPPHKRPVDPFWPVECNSSEKSWHKFHLNFTPTKSQISFHQLAKESRSLSFGLANSSKIFLGSWHSFLLLESL